MLRVADEMLAIAWPVPVLATIAVALLLVVVDYVWILGSRTVIDECRIRQTWLWDKQMEFADIVQAKFIYLPRLTWLIAPRLVVRTRNKGTLVFHCATPAVLRRLARLSLGPLLPH